MKRRASDYSRAHPVHRKQKKQRRKRAETHQSAYQPSMEKDMASQQFLGGFVTLGQDLGHLNEGLGLNLKPPLAESTIGALIVQDGPNPSIPPRPVAFLP